MHSGFILVSMHTVAIVIAHCSNFAAFSVFYLATVTSNEVKLQVGPNICIHSSKISKYIHFRSFQYVVFLFLSSSGCFLFQFSPMI